MRALIADGLVVVGLAVITAGVYGVIRLPDVYTQLHAASKVAVLGIAALLASAAIEGDGATITRSVLVLLLLAFTTPVSAHAVARAAHRRGVEMRSADAVDER